MRSHSLEWKRQQVLKSLCRECPRPMFRGGRCWTHYLRRYTTRHRLRRFAWFLFHEQEFIDLMRQRFFAITDGREVGDVPSVIDIFQHGTKRVWTGYAGRDSRGRQQQRLARVVNYFDGLALKEQGEQNPSDHRREADDTTGGGDDSLRAA